VCGLRARPDPATGQPHPRQQSVGRFVQGQRARTSVGALTQGRGHRRSL
jgi:hypothetical protein